MKKLLVIIFFAILTSHAAENRIDLSNANNDMLSLYLSYVPAKHPVVSELTKTRRCNSDLYDKIVKAYLKRNKQFYIENKDIKNIIKTNFETTSQRVNTKKYQKQITAAFKRYIDKYPYAKLISSIKNENINIYSFLDDLLIFCPIYNYHKKIITTGDISYLDSLDKKDIIQIYSQIKKELKIICNLCDFIKPLKDNSIIKIKSNVANGIFRCLYSGNAKNYLLFVAITTILFFIPILYCVCIKSSFNLRCNTITINLLIFWIISNILIYFIASCCDQISIKIFNRLNAQKHTLYSLESHLLFLKISMITIIEAIQSIS